MLMYLRELSAFIGSSGSRDPNEPISDSSRFLLIIKYIINVKPTKRWDITANE